MSPMNQHGAGTDSRLDTGDKITLAGLRAQRYDILRVAAAHDAGNVRVFGTTARSAEGEQPHSLCVLIALYCQDIMEREGREHAAAPPGRRHPR